MYSNPRALSGGPIARSARGKHLTGYKKGTVAGAQWEFAGYAGERKFLSITNEQTAILGLGPGWRDSHDEPPWRVEIDGNPPIVATFGWPDGVEPGAANSRLNSARAMNMIPHLVAARPGCVSVLDFPAVAASDGLASE